MTISAAFTVNTAANPARHTAAYGATVTLALVSTSGVDSVTFSIVSASRSSETLPTLNESGSPTGQIASFVMPADHLDGLGISFLIKCVVTSQYERVESEGVVGVNNARGLLPIAAGEQLVRDASYGWTDEFNTAMAGATVVVPNAQTGTSYTITASDANKLITLTNASAISLVFPLDAAEDLPDNFACSIYQGGAGQVTLSIGGSGTIESSGSRVSLTGKGSAAAIWKRGSDDIVLIGDLA